MDLNTTHGNATCHPAVINYRYFGALLGILVTAVGTVGNVMTLLAFATDKKLRTRFNLLILNLTIADLLYCGFLQPVTVDTFIHFTWRQGPAMCRVFGLLLFVANSVSIFNLILIAMSRYVLISDPQRFDRIYSRYTMPFFLALPWTLGLALFGPLWKIYVFLPAVCTCSFHRSKGRPYTTILMFFMFGLGLSCIGIFYFLINRKVKAASKALEEYRLKSECNGKKKNNRRKSKPLVVVTTVGAETSGTDSGIADEPSNSQTGNGSSAVTDETSVDREAPSDQRAGPRAAETPATSYQTKKRSDSEFKRVTQMCFAMFIVYVTCYFPFCLLHVVDGRKRAPILVHMIAGNFTWLNSCVNPILYAVMNRQFKEAYWGVIRKGTHLFTRSACLGRE